MSLEKIKVVAISTASISFTTINEAIDLITPTINLLISGLTVAWLMKKLSEKTDKKRG